MATGYIAAKSSVAVEGSVGVNQQVNVGGTGSIVTREHGFELSNAISVGLLNTTEESVVDVGLIRGVTVTGGNNPGVDTGGVAVPHLEVNIGYRLASVDIDDLVVNDSVDALLLLKDLAADVLATDVVRTLSDLGGQDAGVVATEEGSSISVQGVSQGGLVVGGGQHGVKITLVDATAGAGLLESCGSASDVAAIDTAGLQLGSAVGEIGALDGAEEFAALLDLLGQIMSGVSNDGARQQGQA